MSKKNILILALSLSMVALLIYLGIALAANNLSARTNLEPTSVSTGSADVVEVVHFHGTEQCYSCKKIGELAKRTVEERFAAEISNGRVVFRSVNGELPENQAEVQRFQATGSSLFINAITDGTDKIHQDTKVWRLVGDEQSFMDYLTGEINELIGK